MIPLKLQLKNFLSYGSKLQEIEFGAYPFICLSGKNGHGKSALLDAMTWTLWGQARKTSGTTKPDAQLLRLGQTTMLVIFDFAFNGQTYRIRREFALTKKGNTYASLEFGILDPETESVRPLTEKTIRNTQQTIEKMLGLDFESFVNSAFLRQGQANEFSKKSPKDRKEILASILQLDKYETIRKAALEKSKTATTTISSLKQLQERISGELATEEKLSQELQGISKELIAIQQEEKKLFGQLKQLEEKKEQLTKKEQEHQLLTYQIDQIAQQKKEKEKQVLELFVAWRSVCQKQHKLIDQKKLDNEKQTLTKQINFFSQQQQKSLDLKETYLKERENAHEVLSKLKEQYLAQFHKKQINFERLQAEQQHKKVASKDLEKRKKTTNQEYQTLQDELKKIVDNFPKNQKKTKLNSIEKQFDKRKYYYHKWVAQANMLSTELKNLEQKNLLIHDQNPSCPLCEQNLSSSRKRFLKNNFAKLEHSLHHRITRLSHILKKLKETLIKQHQDLDVLKKNQEKQKMLQMRHEEFLKEITKKETTLKELNEAYQQNEKKLANLQTTIKQEKSILEREQSTLDQKIQSDATYQACKATCNKFENQLKELRYDAQAHKKAVEQLQTLQEQEKELIKYLQELSQQHHRKIEIKQFICKLREFKKKLQELEQIIKNHEYNAHKKLSLKQQEEQLTAMHEELRLKKEKLHEQKGSLEQQQQTLKKQQKEYKQHEQKITDLTQTIEDYQTLATALSKDGIQALLIEDALPEIEQEANALLAQLTNNQAHIIIESLRDLKKGGTKETLDIKISDPMGIRPYELFSGGEAFRIDFALRISISKLLARRAGTSLQTLIIDEGFGSQDEEGLGHLMDAIIKIQDDFAKIIIVSHLPSIKDQFPVHFLIHKGPQGSMVNIIVQGKKIEL